VVLVRVVGDGVRVAEGVAVAQPALLVGHGVQVFEHDAGQLLRLQRQEQLGVRDDVDDARWHYGMIRQGRPLTRRRPSTYHGASTKSAGRHQRVDKPATNPRRGAGSHGGWSSR
jgi:hypothetical protein